MYDPKQNSYEQEPAQHIEASDANNKAMFAHLSPFLTVISTIIIWTKYKDKPGYNKVWRAAASCLNIHITVAILGFAYGILACILSFIGALTVNAKDPGILPIMMFIIVILGMILALYVMVIYIFHIIAAVEANKGEEYIYPLPRLRLMNEG